MTIFKKISAFFIALLAVTAIGCAGTSTQQSTSEYVTDAWITTKVKASLAEDPNVKATEVNVETLNGTVQLSGFVASQSAMNQAVRITRSIQGVRAVRNDMRLR